MKTDEIVSSPINFYAVVAVFNVTGLLFKDTEGKSLVEIKFRSRNFWDYLR